MIDLAHATDAEIRAFYERDRDEPSHVDGRDRLPLLREYAVLAAVEQSGARSVLDVGCGDGHLAAIMARAGLDVAIMDASYEATRAAALRAFTRTADRGTDLGAHVGLVEDLEIVKGFDAVTCCETIEHVRDPRAAVARLARAARTVVVLTTPVGHAYDDPSHLHHWGDATEFLAAVGANEVFRTGLVSELPSRWGDEGRVFVLIGTPK